MKNNLPFPVCISFVICREFAREPKTGDEILIGLPRYFWSDNYPAASPLKFFIRCTEAQGNYPVVVQLLDSEDEVVWKSSPSKPWEMMDPLEMYDMKMHACPIFPAPGEFQFVLMIDGQELSRHRFHAKLGKPPARQPKPGS